MNVKSCLIAAFSTFFAACSFGNTMILEKKDTQFFTVKEVHAENGAVNLLISGLSFHSSLTVSEITTEIDNRNLLVKVHLQPATKGGSGNFEYEVKVPSTVTDVLFGNKKTGIWSRE